MSYRKLHDVLESPGSLDALNEELRSPMFLQEQYRRSSTKLLRISVVNLVLLVIQITLVWLHVTAIWPHTKEEHIVETYGFDSNFMTLSHDYDFLWDEAPVKTAGAIALSRDDSGNVIEQGVISMFHELHCVTAMRRALQKAHEGQYVAYDQTEDPHWPHCLHYLRQMILCTANDQIEISRTWNESSPFVDGATDMRQCKNSKHLYELYNEKSL